MCGDIEMGVGFRITMSDFEYESLLDRARDKIPTEISERARWTLPDPEILIEGNQTCLLYTSPSPRDKRQSRMPSSA